MVEGPGLAGKRQDVPPSLVLNFNKAFFDVNVGGSILAHGSELHQMAVEPEFFHGPQHIESSADIVHLGKQAAVVVNHEITRGRLLGIVHIGVRTKSLEHYWT